MTHKLGAPGSPASVNRLAWNPELGFWACIQTYERRGDRHWLGYGLRNPKSTHEVFSPLVETSLAHRGINRRIAGLLARDSPGNVYLLHSGKIRSGKTFFWNRYRGDRDNVRFDDGIREYALIGAIDAPDFVERLSDFVHGIDCIRQGRAYQWRFPKGSGRKFRTKSTGEVTVAVKSEFIRKRVHDEIMNALKTRLRRYPSVARLGEDFRDLHVDLQDGTSVDVEVKPSNERDEIFKGVGQLLLNRVDNAKLLLVTPNQLGEALDLINRLKALSIYHIGYERSENSIKFTGLDAMFSDTARMRARKQRTRPKRAQRRSF